METDEAKETATEEQKVNRILFETLPHNRQTRINQIWTISTFLFG